MRGLIYFFDTFISILSSPFVFVYEDAQISREMVGAGVLHIGNRNAYGSVT